jgi:CheY-like chemotaxis protein
MIAEVDVLLVDDNDDDVFMVREAFSDICLLNIIHHVEDGVKALEYLRKEGEFQKMKAPDIILLDINMPRKNGFEVLEEIKNDPSLRHIPTVILTTSKRDEDIVRAYGSGASSYIRKPVDFEKFIEVMKHFEIYWTFVSKIPITTAKEI